MYFWKGVGGIRIAGDLWGDPGGPLVLLQHGGGQTRHAWKEAGADASGEDGSGERLHGPEPMPTSAKMADRSLSSLGKRSALRSRREACSNRLR